MFGLEGSVLFRYFFYLIHIFCNENVEILEYKSIYLDHSIVDCPEEFGKCYDLEFMFVDMSWTDSEQTCRDKNMSLVIIHTALEFSYMRQLIIDLYSVNYDNMRYYRPSIPEIINSFIGIY
jgi:hypothetical protein